jgi:biopolymer transport protein ExbD
MKRQKSTTTPDAPSLDISSLIDVCFLLLIYFLVATTLQKSETDLGLKLPDRREIDPTMPDLDPLLIRVASSGGIMVGEDKNAQLMDQDENSRNLPLLTSWLKSYADSARAAGKEPIVQIWVDREARQQRVIDVLNTLAGQNIQLATFTDLID